MDCRESERLLRLHVEGELNAVETAGLEKHARECEYCRRELDAALRISAAVEEAIAPEAGAEEARERLTAALAWTPSAAGPSVLRGRAIGRHVAVATAAAALIAIGFLAGRTAYSGPAQPEGPPLAVAIKTLEGTVLVRRAGAGYWVPLETDTPLCLGDTIQTLPQGSVVLSLGPDSNIQVAPGSTLVLRSFNGETELSLNYGSMTAALEGPHAPFNVSTPDGRIRALGTIFRVSVE